MRVFVPPLKQPAFGHARRLRVYLPPDYADSYASLSGAVQFDGQNLFDEAPSYAGEWGVDEAMDTLSRDEGFSAIVVGIDHSKANCGSTN